MDTIPSFLTFDSINHKLTFFPLIESHLGVNNVSIQITDGLDSPIYTFTVTVIVPVVLPPAILNL